MEPMLAGGGWTRRAGAARRRREDGNPDSESGISGSPAFRQTTFVLSGSLCEGSILLLIPFWFIQRKSIIKGPKPQ